MNDDGDTNRRMRVGFVGAGRRVRDYYLPILAGMSDDVDVVGFWSRSQATRDATSAATGLRQMTVEELDEACDVVFVCVPSHASHEVAMNVLSCTTKHVLVETPVTSEHVAKRAWDERGRRLVLAAENWPLRPANVLMRLVVEGAELGRVNAVVNDFRGFEYHGFAMMRTLAGCGRPRAATGTSWSNGPVRLVDGEGNTKTLDENWDVGVVELEDGVKLVHNFNSVHSRSRARGPRSLRVMCSNGFIGADDSRGGQLTVVSPDGTPTDVPIEVEHEGGRFKCIKASLGGRDYEVTNVGSADEEQFSSRLMLAQLSRRVVLDDIEAWVYPAWEAWLDVLCVSGVRHASTTGQRIAFPRIPWMV